MLVLQPISYAEACRFITQHHRHHLPPQGWRFGLALNNGTDVVGVITVGQPVARHLDDTYTLEVTRCCADGTPHACSKLYAAAWRATRALGYQPPDYLYAPHGAWHLAARRRVESYRTDERTILEPPWLRAPTSGYASDYRQIASGMPSLSLRADHQHLRSKGEK